MAKSRRWVFLLAAAILVAGAAACGSDAAQCTPASGCANGQSCVSGQCVIPSGCGRDGDCQIGQICDGVCTPGCRSNRDCPASGEPLCDPSLGSHGTCVVCLGNSDCPATETCVTGNCAASCARDTDCPGSQVCDTARMACVECISNATCAIGEICDADVCVTGCGGDRDCPSAAPHCAASVGDHGTCVECVTADDCGASGQSCENNQCVAVCTSDNDCPGSHCDTSSGSCVQCTTQAQCNLGNLCIADACTPGCTGDRDCPSPDTCDTSAGAHGICRGGSVGDGAPAVSFPAGAYVMGSNGDADTDNPEHTVTVSAFAIDKYEVTNTRYRACVAAAGCATPLDTTQYDDPSDAGNPVVFVTYQMAADYCVWAGKRLPTEAEWEKAASNGVNTYPWGESPPTCSYSNATIGAGDPATACEAGVVIVGSYAFGETSTGLYDMAGNAREWVIDWYAPLAASPASDPVGPAVGAQRVVRGGSFASPDTELQTFNRQSRTPDLANEAIGFRCASGVPLPTAHLEVSPASGGMTTVFSFDASRSSDPSDPSSALRVRYDWESDGTFDTAYSTTKTATHTFATGGFYQTTVQVVNSRGAVSSASVLVSVGGDGSDGSPCTASTMCASGYVCSLSDGVCRLDCLLGQTCPNPSYTCTIAITDASQLFDYVCEPPAP